MEECVVLRKNTTQQDFEARTVLR